MKPITVKDVLDVKHIGAYAWSPDGCLIAYLRKEDDPVDLWVVEVSTGEHTRLTHCRSAVTSFCWQGKGERLALVQDGDLCEAKFKQDGWTMTPLSRTSSQIERLSPTPEGDILAYFSDNRLWWRHDDGLLQEVTLPLKCVDGFMGQPLSWAPDGQHLAFCIRDYDKRWVTGIVNREGEVVYRARDLESTVKPVWVNSSSFIYQVIRRHNLIRDFWRVTLPSGDKELLYQDVSTERGPLLSSEVLPSPDGSHLAYLLERDGWPHLYLQDAKGGELQQLTAGPWEDNGDYDDLPRWCPDGRHILYSSSREHLAQRQLWLVDVESKETQRLTSPPGIDVLGQPSPCGQKVAFMHSDAYRCADLWVLDLAQADEPRQLTQSLPAAWGRETMAPPEDISFTSNGDWEIHGMLVKPPNFDPKGKYPALVWIHGAPILQMRTGWHHLYGYNLTYAFQQYLAQQGYVSLQVNFRGGTGYGRDFRHGLYRKVGVDDVADVVNAGRYLKSLPFVKEDKVGVWGISYGGWLTLHALTQYPEEFALGINIAGIWDWIKAHHWALAQRGVYGEQMTWYMGGEPDQSPELNRKASPDTFAHQMKSPLINLHGQADVNVDVGQLDRIVEDCVRLGKTFEAYYYPGDVHDFVKRSSWEHALARIEEALKKYLEC